MSEYFYATSQRGTPKIHSNGYIYTYKRETITGVAYRCEKRTCPGNIRIFNGKLLMLNGHNHEVDHTKSAADRIKTSIKQRALTNSEPPKDIITRYLSGVDQTVAVVMPKYRNLIDWVTTIRRDNTLRLRKVIQQYPMNSKIL